jgi:hypothetical protein
MKKFFNSEENLEDIEDLRLRILSWLDFHNLWSSKFNIKVELLFHF